MAAKPAALASFACFTGALLLLATALIAPDPTASAAPRTPAVRHS